MTRKQIWLDMLIRGINEGVESGAIKLDPKEDRPFEDREVRVCFFEAEGRDYVVSFRDIGFDEVEVSVVADPTVDDRSGRRSGRFPLAPLKREDCSAVAMGWLERRRGAWIMASAHPHYLRLSARFDPPKKHPRPLGFKKEGRLII